MNLDTAIKRFHEIDNKTGIISCDVKINPNRDERNELWDITRVFLDRIYSLDIDSNRDPDEYNELCHWSIVALHWCDLMLDDENFSYDNGRFRRDTVALALCLYTRINRRYDHHSFIRTEFMMPHSNWSFFLWTTQSIIANNHDNIFNQFSPDEAKDASDEFHSIIGEYGYLKFNDKHFQEGHPVTKIWWEIYRRIKSNRIPFKFALNYIWMGPGMPGGMGLLSVDRDMNKDFLQNQISHKQFDSTWNFYNDLAYAYMYFAKETDGDFTEEEKSAVSKWVGSYYPDEDRDEYLEETLNESMELFSKDNSLDRFSFVIENLRTHFKIVCEANKDDSEHPSLMKKLNWVLSDLVEIAKADGKIVKEEFDLIEEIRDSWGVDVKLFDDEIEAKFSNSSQSDKDLESVFDSMVGSSEKSDQSASKFLDNYPGDLYCENSRWDSEEWKDYYMTVKPFLNVFEDGEYQRSDLFRRFTKDEVNLISNKIKESGKLIYLPFVRKILSKKFDMRGLKNPFWFDPFIISGALNGAAGLFYFEQNGFVQNTHDNSGNWTDPESMNLVSHVDLVAGMSLEKGYNKYWDGYLDGCDLDKVTTMDIDWYNPNSGNSGFLSFVQTHGETYASTLPIVKAIWDNAWGDVVERSKSAGCFLLGPPPVSEHFDSWDELLDWAQSSDSKKESSSDIKEIENAPAIEVQSSSDSGVNTTMPEEIISYLDKYVKDTYTNLTSKTAKSGLTSYYFGKKKILQIAPASKGRVELLILRDYKHNYLRPSVNGLDISNIRKYDPSVKSYRRPWGYMFFKVLVTPPVFNQFSIEIYSLIDSGYNTAADDKILKVSDSEHEKLGPVFEGTFAL